MHSSLAKSAIESARLCFMALRFLDRFMFSDIITILSLEVYFYKIDCNNTLKVIKLRECTEMPEICTDIQVRKAILSENTADVKVT